MFGRRKIKELQQELTKLKDENEKLKEENARLRDLPDDVVDQLTTQVLRLYADAKARQKNPDAAPSQYMRGIDAAYKVLSKFGGAECHQ